VCLAEDVHRIGPYRDEIRGRGAYVAFLARVIGKLPGYRLEVGEIHALTAGGAFAEIRETVLRDGVALVTPEALYFGFDGAGQIARVRVYVQQAP
jgi:hypothetical protein